MSRRAWLIIAVVVVVFAAGITVGVTVLGNRSSAAAVTLEPNTSTGTDPFTSSVAISPVAESANGQGVTAAARKTLSTNPKTHTLVATGTAPGLYGGSGNTHVCDAQQLVGFLQQHPDKAAAWAGVLGITTGKIADYVATLTPVLLTNDTLVTNHGFRNGHATTLQSVLQAGTAVMVDATGTPRVKCNCGNPLTPADPTVTTARLRGTGWPGYTPTQVTVVNAGPATQSFTLVNITTGDTYTQPVGNGGGEFVAASSSAQQSQTTISTSSDGTTWKTLTTLTGRVRGLAWGNGKWLALRTSQGNASGSAVLESTDLKTWNQVATEPDNLEDIVYGNGRWIAVGRVAVHTGTINDAFPPAAVYASSNGETLTRVASLDHAPPFTSVAYGDDAWIAVGNGIHQGGEPSFAYRSTDGTTWTRETDTGLSTSEAQGELAFGAGRWVVGGLDVSPSGGYGGAQSGIINTSTNATNWSSGGGSHFAGNTIRGVAYGNGQWLAVSANGDMFASSDGATWSKRGHVAAQGWDLAFGGGSSTVGAAAPPASTTPTAAATTTTPTASSLRGIDWKNYTYKDLACGTDKLVKFTNGAWVPPSNGAATCYGMSFVSVDFADVTGDGVPDAIVNLQGHASGVIEGESSWTTVFTASPSGPVNHGYLHGVSFPPYSAGITTWTPHLVGNDPNCCPSQFQKDAYTYSNGKFTKSGTTYVPANQLPKR